MLLNAMIVNYLTAFHTLIGSVNFEQNTFEINFNR